MDRIGRLLHICGKAKASKKRESAENFDGVRIALCFSDHRASAKVKIGGKIDV
jgi:hypothetical protein